MPLPKPQAALLFNNYYDYNTGEGVLNSNTDPLNVFMIAADAYFTFGNKPNSKSKFKAVFKDATEPKTSEKDLVLTEVSKGEYPSVLKAPDENNTNFQLFNTGFESVDFSEVTSESLALFLKEVENVTPKEKLEATIDFLKNNMKEVDLYNATIKFPRETIVVLDALYSNKTIDDKLSVPYVAGKDQAAAGQEIAEVINDKQFAGGGGNFGAAGFKADFSTDSKKDLKNQPGFDASKAAESTGGFAGGNTPFDF